MEGQVHGKGKSDTAYTVEVMQYQTILGNETVWEFISMQATCIQYVAMTNQRGGTDMLNG